MNLKVPQTQARLFGRAGESVTRGDRRKRELEFGSSFPPLTARPNRRRDAGLGWPTEASPLGGAPRERKNGDQTLTPVGHLIMTPAERRFAPTTVRQDWNGVRYGLEQVSDISGIRSGSVAGRVNGFARSGPGGTSPWSGPSALFPLAALLPRPPNWRISLNALLKSTA